MGLFQCGGWIQPARTLYETRLIMTHKTFFCGIGGSGMLPLALIVQGLGAVVAGSDRSRDQGRTPAKFAFLSDRDIELFPQDGSGIDESVSELVVSTAVEDSIPDVRAARAHNVPIVHRAALLARLFNLSDRRVAVAGTSGKSTVTGMLGYILFHMGEQPTVMNGAVMRDFVSFANPYASALVGNGGLFVAEADESDGSIALYEPDVAVITNIALDHKDMNELRGLFADLCGRAGRVVLNGDHAETAALAAQFPDKTIVYRDGDHPDLVLQVPGRHNRSNAAAALAVIEALDLDVAQAKEILKGFTGTKRRLETVGTEDGVTVIDDFAHNPDKVAGSLSALKETPGRLLVMFQPHGFGMLKLTGAVMGDAFRAHLSADDKLYVTEPLYLGGTVDTSVGAEVISTPVYADRNAVLKDLLREAKPGDRIVVMGARDDTLSEFAAQIVSELRSRKQESP